MVVDGRLIGVARVHGGVKFYRGAAKAARSYVERDRSRADDYYLGEGTGVAERLTATPDGVERVGSMDGDTYEQWVGGIDIDTGVNKGRLLKDERALRFVEVTVNGPKTWSLAAALHPEISAALDAAQDKAATEIVGWVASQATTRVGPRGRQVQVPVEKIEAAVIRHYTSRAGDPHRHLHLQISARICAAGGWRGIHSVGFRDSIEAINGIGHAAVATDPEFRAALAAHGLTLDPETNEIRELAPYVAPSAPGARRSDATSTATRLSGEPSIWVTSRDRGSAKRGTGEHGPRLVPTRWSRSTGGNSSSGGTRSCKILAIAIPARPSPPGHPARWIDRDAAADLLVSVLGTKASAGTRPTSAERPKSCSRRPA